MRYFFLLDRRMSDAVDDLNNATPLCQKVVLGHFIPVKGQLRFDTFIKKCHGNFEGPLYILWNTDVL